MEDQDLNEYTWNWTEENYWVPPFYSNDSCGPNTEFDEHCLPSDLLTLFITSELMDLIVTQTNRNARETIEANIHSKYGEYLNGIWYDITIEEFKAYLGIILASGLVQLKSWKEY